LFLRYNQIMNNERNQILLTNDDGIQSPGLWSAAEALSSLGFVTVAAPRDQASASGRSLPMTSDGKISTEQLRIGKQKWNTYAIGGTPAQTVLHALLEIVPSKPDLVVSGINYGENVGHSITISGTVMAALEAASMGIKAMAVSLQMHESQHLSHSKEVNFETAAFFTNKFAKLLLNAELPDDVDVLKIDIPQGATPDTEWRITKLARHRYYTPILNRKGEWAEKGFIDYRMDVQPIDLPHNTDIYTLVYDKLISVTPISLDLSSRIDLIDLDQQFREDK